MSNADIDGLKEYIRIKTEEKRIFLEKHPPYPPNDVCFHAILRGMTIENSFEPKVGEYILLLESEYEKIYIWTHTQNENSALVSQVRNEVKGLSFWKNIGSIIKLSKAYCDAFEGLGDNEIEYKWIYHFNPVTTTIDKAVFYNLSDFEIRTLSNGYIVKATLLSNMASIIELLLNDNVCYTALTSLYSAFQIHNCCLICEISDHPWHDHLADEPKIWEHSGLIPYMELAIVQSCRCVESILGEPPNRTNMNSLLRHKAKWKAKIGINADDVFAKAEMSYLEFYYSLFFDLRNPSAHSYGNIHFDLERKKAIQAQCFAAIILRGYIETNEKSNEEAMRLLNFNNELLYRVSETMSTKMTYGYDYLK